MVLVPAGSFEMGCAPSDTDCTADERPRHPVYLDAFHIDRTEATVAAYRSCVGSGHCTVPTPVDEFCNWDQSGHDDHPINCVDWNQARAHCRWAQKRLPTEAEWERAARGPFGGRYPWGNAWFPQWACWNRLQTTPDLPLRAQVKLGTCSVGSHPQGASPEGALDMAGNVWEWVNDWSDDNYYAGAAQRNPTGPSEGTERVIRGGGWNAGEAPMLLAVNRSEAPPEERAGVLGFRCARAAQ